MKNLPLILLVSLSVLTACQEDKTQEKAAEVTKPAVTAEAPAKAEKVVVAKAPETAPAKTTAKPAAEKPTAETSKAEEADADDEESGAALHKDNCARCHDDAFYAKPDSRMKDYAGLHKMVGMCDAQLGTELFPEELEKITDYLNSSFYKFKK